MLNPNACAYPATRPDGDLESGLTIREHFAAMAMQGMLANEHFFGPLFQQKPEAAAEFATACADELISALNKESHHE